MDCILCKYPTLIWFTGGGKELKVLIGLKLVNFNENPGNKKHLQTSLYLINHSPLKSKIQSKSGTKTLKNHMSLTQNNF